MNDDILIRLYSPFRVSNDVSGPTLDELSIDSFSRQPSFGPYGYDAIHAREPKVKEADRMHCISTC